MPSCLICGLLKSLRIKGTVKMHQEKSSLCLMTFVKWYFKPLNIHSKTQTKLFVFFHLSPLTVHHKTNIVPSKKTKNARLRLFRNLVDFCKLSLRIYSFG